MFIEKMVEEHPFRKLIDDDLMRLKFLLKSKVASFDEIKAQEEEIIETIKKVMTKVKEMEMVLEGEIGVYKKLVGGWEKAYTEKRWKAIGHAIQDELEDFNQEYGKTKDVYNECLGLHNRLHKLVALLKGMNSKNKETREKELQMLEDFRQQKKVVGG